MSLNIIPIKTGQPVNTAADVRQWLSDHGYSIARFCREHSVPLDAAKSLIYDRSKGQYGKSHEAAVALGMKVPTADSVCSSRREDSPTRGLREHLIQSDVSARNSCGSGYSMASAY